MTTPATAANAIRADYTQRGRAAYEAHVALIPNYHDGTPRVGWDGLDAIARWSWETLPRAMRLPRNMETKP